MKKIIVIVLLAVVGVLIAMFIAQRFAQNLPPLFPFMSSKQGKVTINNQTFSVKLAQTNEEKEKGLSGTSSLSEKSGMLFVFDEPGYHSFWMKNMKFPIDMIYISDQKVVTIYKNAQPLSSDEESPIIYKPESPADMVLEINAGEADKYNMKSGDTVKIEGVDTKNVPQ